MRNICFLFIAVSILFLFGCFKSGTVNQSQNIFLISPSNEIKKVTSLEVREIKKGMTYQEIIEELGETIDIGSGRYVVIYIIDNNKRMILSFDHFEDVCAFSGQELFENAEIIKN